jgi:hypothetical protein
MQKGLAFQVSSFNQSSIFSWLAAGGNNRVIVLDAGYFKLV